MKDTKIIGLFSLMSIMTIGLTAAPIYGQASTTTSQSKFMFGDGRVNPCNGEFVSFDGTLTFVYHSSETPNGGFITSMNVQSTGNGQGDLGNSYRIADNFHFQFVSQPDAGQVQSQRESMHVISQSSDDNFLLEAIITVTFNANGEISHVVVDFGQPRCVG